MDGYISGWMDGGMDEYLDGWIGGVNEWKVRNKKDNSRKWSDEVVTWL